jgi:hypothetical protein
MDTIKEIHFPSAALAAVAGTGLIYFISKSPALAQSFPKLFTPFWTYILPIALIVAGVTGAIAAALAPVKLGPRSGDLAGVCVGMAACLTLLENKPNLVMLFLISIAYGFVGFAGGALIAGIKSSISGEPV